MWRLEILVRDRREKHQTRCGLAVVFLLPHAVDRAGEIGLEFCHAGFAFERLVVTEESKDDVGFDLGQPLIRAAEIFRALSQSQFIAGKSEVTKRQIQIGMHCLDVGFEPAVMLQAVGSCVSDVGDVFAFLQRQLLSLDARYKPDGEQEHEQCNQSWEMNHRSLSLIDSAEVFKFGFRALPSSGRMITTRQADCQNQRMINRRRSS